ncbi:hypothetical protein Tco_1440149 [Tanacetum coccineum]
MPYESGILHRSLLLPTMVTYHHSVTEQRTLRKFAKNFSRDSSDYDSRELKLIMNLKKKRFLLTLEWNGDEITPLLIACQTAHRKWGSHRVVTTREFGHFAMECRSKNGLETLVSQGKDVLCKPLKKDSGTDAEPLEHVHYDTDNNVFANDLQHFEQSESIRNTCAVVTGDSNVNS